jgi:hypothetical protein
MLQIDHPTLREGLERAGDMLKLQRLSSPEHAERLASTVLANFGIDRVGRIELNDALGQMLPIGGDPVLEAMMQSTMREGVLVGLLIATAALEPEPGAVPDFPPLEP